MMMSSFVLKVKTTHADIIPWGFPVLSIVLCQYLQGYVSTPYLYVCTSYMYLLP